MHNSLIDLSIQLLVLGAYLAFAAGSAALGLVFEYRSYLFISSGESVLALWIAGLGAVLFGFSYLVTRDKLPGAYEAIR